MGKTQLKVRIDCFRWILFLGVIPFDKAALTLYRSNEIGNILSYCLLLITIIIIGFRLVQHKNNREYVVGFFVNRIHIIFILITVLYFMSGLINENLKLSRALSLFCLWAYYVFSLLEYDDSKKLINDISNAAVLLIIISLFLYFINNRNVYYQESATVFSFKGVALNRNGYIEFALFPVLNYWCNAINNGTKSKIICALVCMISLYSIIITKSATSIVCIVLFLFFLLLRRPLKRVFSLRLFFVFYIIAFAVTVIADSSNNWYLNWISNFFGRSTTLTGRTTFWPTTLQLIQKKPILGYGIDTNVLLECGIIENDPHNGLLYLLLTSGIIGAYVFLHIIIKMMNKAAFLLKIDDTVYCVIAFIISWLVRGIVESPFSYTHYIFWTLVIIVFRICYESPQSR